MKIHEFTKENIDQLLPDRDPYAHKGCFGRILLLCGSIGFTGAAYLAAMGALRAGAGLVYLGVPESIYHIEAVKLNEAVVFPLPEQDGMLSEAAIPELAKRLPRMDAVLFGCGSGCSAGTLAVESWLIRHAACPLILDADAITMLHDSIGLLQERPRKTILTPHDGEFVRLGFPLSPDRMAAAAAAAAKLNSIMVLKGHRSCITDGTCHYRNCTGNPGMAVGGSGDMLAGIIAALAGQKIAPLEAAAAACWLHGVAGDICAERMGQYGLLPTDMLNVLPSLLK